MSRATKACDQCGKQFERDVRCTWAHWYRARFCSRECTAKFNSASAKSRRKSIEVEFARWFGVGSGCWEWRGARDKDGYGIFSYAKKSMRAHAVALQIDGRPVPRGKYACHHCDNPGCVNPAHLYVGTPQQNVADAVNRGRMTPERNAKLSVDAVRAIRAASETNSELAAKYGVAPSSISHIKTRKTWSHIP